MAYSQQHQNRLDRRSKRNGSRTMNIIKNLYVKPEGGLKSVTAGEVIALLVLLGAYTLVSTMDYHMALTGGM